MVRPFAAIAVALLAAGLPIRATAQLSNPALELPEFTTAADGPAEKADPPTASPSTVITDQAELPKADDNIPPTPVAENDSNNACDSGNNSCGCYGSCNSCESPYCCSSLEKLSMKNCLGMACCSNWEIGGWTEAGYTNNNVPLSQAYNDLLSFNDVPDHLHLNQQWFYVGRKADGSCGADWGFRVDMLYGTDAQKTQAFGNPNAGVRNEGTFDASWDNGEYGWALPQLYGEVAYGDTSVKVGHFFTPLGYEVVPATGNFFYTHSYTFFNSEPFTHTGMLATNKSIDGLTLYGGWTLGWDTGFDQLNSGNNGIAGFTKQVNDCTTFTYICTFGNFGWRDGGSNNSYQHSIVLDMKLSKSLEWVIQSDDVSTRNTGISQFDTVGAVNYLFYTVSDKVKLGSRTEWWKADGVSFYEATIGPNFNIAKNCVFRPEWRQDWAPGIGLDEDTFAVDMVLSY